MPKSKRKAACGSSTAHARGTQSDQCDLSRSPALQLCPQCCWEGQPRGQLLPALPCCPQGSCTEQMCVPQLWTQGCWSLRLDGDLVASASCLESPGMAEAVPPCLPALPGVAAPRWPRAGLQWLVLASRVTQGRKCHQCSPQSLPGPAQGIWGLCPEVRNLSPNECPELFLWDKTL